MGAVTAIRRVAVFAAASAASFPGTPVWLCNQFRVTGRSVVCKAIKSYWICVRRKTLSDGKWRAMASRGVMESEWMTTAPFYVSSAYASAFAMATISAWVEE